jgi:hypothetical protein
VNILDAFFEGEAMTLADKRDDLGETKRLMGALVRMKPKQHEEMKVGKKKAAKASAKKRASSKPKNA